MIQRKLLVILALSAICALPSGTFAQDAKDEKASPPEKPAAAATEKPAATARRQLTPEERLKRLQESLKLTDEQFAKVKTIMEEQRKSLAELRSVPREERAAKRKEFTENTTAKYKAVLTPEQFEKWQKRQQAVAGGARARRNNNANANGNPPPPPKE